MSAQEGPDWDKLWKERPVLCAVFTLLKITAILCFFAVFLAILFDWYVPTSSTPVHLGVLLMLMFFLCGLTLPLLGLLFPELEVVPPSRRKLMIGVLVVALIPLCWVSFIFVAIPFASTTLVSVNASSGVPVDIPFAPPQGEAVYAILVVSSNGSGYDRESPIPGQCKHAGIRATAVGSAGDELTRDIEVYVTSPGRRSSTGCLVNRATTGELRVVDHAMSSNYHLYAEQISGTAALTEVHLRSRPAWLFGLP